MNFSTRRIKSRCFRLRDGSSIDQSAVPGRHHFRAYSAVKNCDDFFGSEQNAIENFQGHP